MTLTELAKILDENYPIAADQVGMTYSDAYEEVAAEHQKHQSLYGERPDYQVMIKNTILLIQQGSGHLLVMVSLCNAALQLYKEQGMIAACIFLNKYLNQHWQVLYPGMERLRGRAQMLEWLLERFKDYFEKNPITHFSPVVIDRLLGVLDPLQITLSARFSDALSLVTLIHPLEDQRRHLQQEAKSRETRRKHEEEKREREAKEMQLQKEQNMLQTLDEHAKAVSHEEYLAGIDTCELHQLASKRLMTEKLETLKNNLFSHAIYKHNRAEMWWRYPMSSAELLNLIDAQGFDWQGYSEAHKLKASQHYEEALLAFEALSHLHPFYLPLQLHVCNCLEDLGADQALLEMLKAECKALWRHYPELEEAKINNELAVLDRNVRRYFDLYKPLQENNKQEF